MDTLLADARPRYSVEEANARCEKLAETHYQDLTVCSWLLPRDTRSRFHATHVFCHFVDNLGDGFPGDKTQVLDLEETGGRPGLRGHAY